MFLGNLWNGLNKSEFSESEISQRIDLAYFGEMGVGVRMLVAKYQGKYQGREASETLLEGVSPF